MKKCSYLAIRNDDFCQCVKENLIGRPRSVLVCSRVWLFPSPIRINYLLHFFGPNLDIMPVVFVDPFVKMNLGQVLS